MSQKKQAKVCGQTKIANEALSPSQGEATSTLLHPMVYTIAQHHPGIGSITFVQTFFSLLGRSGQSGLAKKKIWLRNKVHMSTNDLLL
jgi:hypothetical protein